MGTSAAVGHGTDRVASIEAMFTTDTWERRAG